MVRVITIVSIIALYSCSGTSTESAKADTKNVELDSGQVAEIKAEGKMIAQSAFRVLSGQLQNAMAEGGIPNAIEYCNVAAYPLTDSLRNHFSLLKLKRATDRPRNLKNALTEEERTQFEQLKKLKMQGDLQAIVTRNNDGTATFYAPILLKGQCLSCHGTKQAIGEDYSLIKEKYPEDKAVGYSIGDLRGMWSITFKEDKNG